MKKPTKKKKPQARGTRSFIPSPDVAIGLAQAQARGISLTWIINKSLFRYLTDEGFMKKG